MMSAFVVLGSCSIGLGAALNRVAVAKSAGPWLVMTAGAATAAAGAFRRDHMLRTGPGVASESWHNQVHDVVSGVAYGAMLAAPLVLGRRFRADPDWAVLARPVQVLALDDGLPDRADGEARFPGGVPGDPFGGERLEVRPQDLGLHGVLCLGPDLASPPSFQIGQVRLDD